MPARWSQAELLIRMVILDLPAGRTGSAAVHLRQALQQLRLSACVISLAVMAAQ